MRYINALIGVAFAALLSCAVYADDVPQDDLGAQKLDKLECVDENTQRCINDECQNSEEIDCQDNCKKLSQEKCQEEMNE